MTTPSAVRLREPRRAPTRKLRVLQIGKYYPPFMGGIETHLQNLCLGLREEVDLSVLVANNGSANKREVIDDVAVERLGTRFQLAGAPVCRGMAERIRRENADIIHLHLPNPAAVLAYLASGNRAPVVVSYHSDVVRQKLLSWAFEPFLHKLLRRSSAVIAATPHHVDNSAVLSRYRDRCEVIPYGIPLERYDSIDQSEVDRIRAKYGPRLVIAVGRLVYYKGFEHLIEAMTRVDARLLLIGEGPLRGDLMKKADELRVADRVEFLGGVADPVPYYQAADVFVLPSIARSEAFGIVQLEAMACGTPVINTRLPSGVPYVSRHEQTGLTVEPGNSAALAHAIGRLLGDRELRDQLGCAARRRVREEFDQAGMSGRTLDLYRSVVDNGRRRD